MKVKRCRTSAIPMGWTVGTRRRPIDWDTHRLRLGRRLHYLREYHYLAKPLDLPSGLTNCVDAALCGRFVALATAHTAKYEYCSYCRNTTLCPTCRAISRGIRARSLYASSLADGATHLLDFVFTAPRPRTADEESELLQLVGKDGVEALRKGLRTYSQRIDRAPQTNSGEPPKRPGYVLGIHLKRSPNDPFLWSHLHLQLLTSMRSLRAATGATQQTVRILRQDLDRRFSEAIGSDFSTHARLKQHRLPTYTPQDAQTLRARHRAVPISRTHAENKLKYAMEPGDFDDTPETVVARLVLLREAGIPRTYSTSQSPGGDAPRESPPHAFPPDVTGKAFYTFPLDRSDPTWHQPGEYPTVYAAVRQEIERQFVIPKPPKESDDQ